MDLARSAGPRLVRDAVLPFVASLRSFKPSAAARGGGRFLVLGGVVWVLFVSVKMEGLRPGGWVVRVLVGVRCGGRCAGRCVGGQGVRAGCGGWGV